MFGDIVYEKYLSKFEEIIQDVSLEDYLEQEDLSVAEALYYLYINGYIRSPYETTTQAPSREELDG